VFGDAFPTLVSAVGPVAPPVLMSPPSVSLSTGSSAADGRLAAGSLAADIRGRVPAAAASLPGVDAAVDDFASRVAARFTAWRATAAASNLIGSGPVPTFAPPNVPVGQVVGGAVTGNVAGPAF